MAYFDRKNGDGTEVLCDQCGFTKHHRPTRETDCATIRCENNGGPVGWSWDPYLACPTGEWCWAPCWSDGFHPCAQCRKNANAYIPLVDIFPSA